MINVRITHFSCLLFMLLSLLWSHRSQILSHANDTINTNQGIRHNQTLVSSGGSFELGFFSPGNSLNWYVGVWYKNMTPRTVVWVANREIPLKNVKQGFFKVIVPGFLVLLDEGNGVVWSSSNTSRPAQNPVLQLLDSGNLVLREENSNIYLWQSFEYPTDTYIPGSDLGSSSVTGKEIYLSSWRSDEDPAFGGFTFHLDTTGYPQVVIQRGGVVVYRVGPWNGQYFSGAPDVREDPTYKKLRAYKNKNGDFYFREDAINRSYVTRFTLSPSGAGHTWAWADRSQRWVRYFSIPSDNCDTYNICGAYGSCTIGNSPVCGCLEKFVPNDERGWMRADWSNGCVRRKELNCASGDGFLKYSGIKLPDARSSWYNEYMSLEECRVECLKNCNCTAFTHLNISNGGSGCLIWFGDLFDIRVSAWGQDVNIRIASSELDSDGKRRETPLILGMTAVGIGLLGLSLLLYIWKRMKNDRKRRKAGIHTQKHIKDLHLPLFDLFTISKATSNFSTKNKLGEGGYGPVYKGILEGQDIAVKRLSKNSNQGPYEFKNEVNCIAKLQHRNLVKLLGCCIEGDEKMLIYEYMPNKSLDMILFDKKREVLLDWPKRFHIVNGIARGLMYLHQDSCLRIIHRDLKASNVLLDNGMNPKISDFGIAKRFRGNETEDNTSRVVGTYGYMSPEYAVHGRFSTKSDVFSFGVLVLEIVSGKRNSSFCHEDHHNNLLGHAWKLYKEGRSTEIVETYLQDSASLSEVERLIHIGLLCVQQRPDDRPSMSYVVAMLSNEVKLPQANQPGFFTESEVFTLESSNNVNPNPNCSTNKITITLLHGR